MCFTSYDVQELAGEGRHQHPVVSSVRNHQPLAVVVHGNLPWERQQAGGQGVSQQLDAQLVLLELAALPVVAQGSVGEERQLVSVALTHHREEQVTPRAQQNQRGPARHLQLVPEERLSIVNHWVADVVTQHGAADVVDDLRGRSHRFTQTPTERWLVMVYFYCIRTAKVMRNSFLLNLPVIKH